MTGTRADDGTGSTDGWYATVWADRDYHDLVRSRQPAQGTGEVDPDDVGFPPDLDPREIPLRGDEVRIGRRGTGTEPSVGTAPETEHSGEHADGVARPEQIVPDIDLAGPPRDPGVSHLHAVLLALPGGRWVVIDVGSTNGTTVNYAEDPLVPDAPQPLRSGDRIHLGAWTTITVDRR